MERKMKCRNCDHSEMQDVNENCHYHREELVWRRNIKPRPLRMQMQLKVWKEAA